MTTTSRDKIEQHLIQQKARAVQLGTSIGPGEGDRCQYRTDSGAMCAAGCLIPDDKYDVTMEGLTANGVINNFPGAFPTDISEHELGAWQQYHDSFWMFGHKGYSYKAWIAGDEEQHPSKFKHAVADWVERYQGVK